MIKRHLKIVMQDLPEIVIFDFEIKDPNESVDSLSLLNKVNAIGTSCGFTFMK